MPEITHISVERKGRRRERAIFLDGERAFAVAEESFLRLGLSVGQMLDEALIHEIETTDGVARARESALQLLNYRMRTRHEMEQRLTQKGWSSRVITPVLESLERAGLIDDALFARLWVDDRMRLRPSGIALLRRELRRKGVADDIIDTVLQDHDHESDEMTRAHDLLQRRRSRYEGLEPQVAKRRMVGFLARRGFSSHTIFTAVHQVLDSMEE